MKRFLTCMAIASATMGLGSAEAATISVLGSAPTVNGADIANLNTTVTSGDIINGDRAAAGQTFTTGGDAAAYELSALTIYNTRTVGSSGGTWNFRLGTVVGTAFTEIYADSVTVGNNALNLSGNGDDFIQFVLTTPQALAPGTLYGVDIVRTAGGNFLTWGETNDVYAGGVAYTSPPNGTGGPTLSLDSARDKVFHLDIDTVLVPEPASLALLGLGGVCILGRRRR